ncbi:hypothetical protein [Pseudarthrobacter sp. NamB4]|uniref:hypothetical protein n=1 Tax=Pseudarthrobacter sp. NamB4 TaxID=2576837 RepID=UPI0010FDE1D8|nr:hypothetical protein [Pseudarthrobacter sp. NamB4]TLM74576.1 hypothetical protein FDW81_05010 [Pseudarthrobacter sp. NamB4]
MERSTGHRWYSRAAELFRRDSEDWRIPPRQALLLALLPLVLAVVVAATVPFKEFYLWLVDEDSLIEWLQFLCLLGACILLPIITFRLFRSGLARIAVLYGLVTLGVWFLTGEEISWGQRIFGWDTPEDLEEVNRQGETTVHNIRGVQELVPVAMLLASLYGACVPLVSAALGDRWRGLAARKLLVPPLCLVPAFLLAAAYRLFRLLIWPEPTFVISEYGEVMELCLYLGLALFCWFNLRLLRRPQLEAETGDAPRRLHRRAM